MPAFPPAMSTRSCSGISTPASRRRILPPRWCCRPIPALRFKPATRVENACATGSAAVHQGIRAIAAGAAKIVLVVGVEQMTRTPPAEIGRNLLRASYLPEDGDTPGGFAGVFGKIAQAYFQKYGDQSDALAMIAAKNHKNGVANPYAQMRKDFGYEFCRSESEKNPFVAGPAEAHRLLAGVGRRRGAGADGSGDREDDGQGGQHPRHRACPGFPADVEARHPAVRRLHRGLAARAADRPACSFPICPLSKPMTASPSPN